MRFPIVLTSFAGLFCLVSSHGEHETGQKNPLHDSKLTHDKEHIKEHLKDEVDIKDEQMSDEDLQFHYFKLHDYDNNNKLDGIELMNAMTHYHNEEGAEGKTPQYSENEMGNMIDQILEEDDLNKDGYIDYPEFVASQKS
ncbi:Multiple coagulation factor deficiency protein 2-like protein [Acropora cervicornis]|uniref:Multiple coagulation factor deficiency protein 2-like protein n=1 Tax=Acropora cervicornis TaxID=6130 RepID=A0AAD9VAR2_ACRCE|nr:Multiple coagulation factor deficiency protein 2-like protein [Acropora cervicornis]